MNLKPNENGGPYIFVSYSHTIKDEAEVVIQALQNNGYRVWFDSGLVAGSSYNAIIADHIAECEVFCCLLSEGYYDSSYCKQEFAFAKVEMKKPIIPVYMGQIQKIKKSFDNDLKMLLSNIHAISFISEDRFIKEVEESGLAERCRNNSKSEKIKLMEFFAQAGLEVIDKRESGGALWVVGSKEEIETTINQACKEYHISGRYDSGRATRGKPGWFTRSKK